MRKAQGTKHFKVIDGKKICSLCLVDKPVSDFFKDNRSGKPRNRCKKCHTNLNKKSKVKKVNSPLKPKRAIPFWKQGMYGINPITMQLNN